MPDSVSSSQTVPANDPVNPNHYRELGAYSALHVVEKWGLNYLLGNSLKYMQRAGKKPGATALTDLRKARWYLQRQLHILAPDEEDDPAAND